MALGEWTLGSDSLGDELAISISTIGTCSGGNHLTLNTDDVDIPTIKTTYDEIDNIEPLDVIAFKADLIKRILRYRRIMGRPVVGPIAT